VNKLKKQEGTMKPISKIALVTGGGGFIGSHIVEALLSENYQVSVIDNLSSGHLKNIEHLLDRIQFFENDIRDSDKLEEAMDGCDTVFHLAAAVSVPWSVDNPIESASINDMGTLSVLETARKKGVRRVVFSSSSAVYGDSPGIPKHEQMMPNPCSPYAAQKLISEYNAGVYDKLHGLETVCLRYFNVYGPRQDPSSPYSGVISIFMSRAVSETEPVIFGDGLHSRDFIFVKDVVKANLLAATNENASGEIMNVGTGKSITMSGLWELVSELSGCGLKPRHGPVRQGDVRDSLADITRIRSVLEFEPEYDLKTGMQTTYEWYKRGTEWK
jgi:nucleoside-diphosphate-sugar epimerase